MIAAPAIHPGAHPGPVPEPIAEAFARGLPLGGRVDATLRDALRGALDRPGALVRARLAFDTAKAFALPKARAADLAVAVEYFHTASLLFDDLPCMDDAAERRGGACLHRTFGEGQAILAALGLVNRGYALVWGALGGLPPRRQAAAGAYVEACLGVAGLLSGQSADLSHARRGRPRPSPQQVAAGKTAPLLRLALVLPAMLGGAGAVEVRLLERLALFWGVSYQILDDLKDLRCSPGATGKTGARDLPLGRPNLVVEIGGAGAARQLHRLLALADQAVDRLVAPAPHLAYLEAICRRFREEVAVLDPAVAPA